MVDCKRPYGITEHLSSGDAVILNYHATESTNGRKGSTWLRSQRNNIFSVDTFKNYLALNRLLK